MHQRYIYNIMFITPQKEDETFIIGTLKGEAKKKLCLGANSS